MMGSARFGKMMDNNIISLFAELKMLCDNFPPFNSKLLTQFYSIGEIMQMLCFIFLLITQNNYSLAETQA